MNNTKLAPDGATIHNRDLCRHGYPAAFRYDCSCGGEPELAFAPCPDPRTFSFLENMRDARAALRTARAKLQAARVGFPNEGAQRATDGWPHPSTMLMNLGNLSGDTPPPTTDAGCLIWGAIFGGTDTLDGAGS